MTYLLNANKRRRQNEFRPYKYIQVIYSKILNLHVNLNFIFDFDLYTIKKQKKPVYQFCTFSGSARGTPRAPPICENLI